MSGKEANMAEYVLENNILKVTVDSKGCEIRDVLCKTDNTHRMWNANPEGWKRVAPVLFPLIEMLLKLSLCNPDNPRLFLIE